MPESKEATKDTTNEHEDCLSPVEAGLMSREIEFRQAITEDDGAFWWHYWGYLHTCTKGLPVFINPMAPLEHDLRPSYQYTGHKTRGGVKMYTGDICKGGSKNFVVEWSKKHLCWVARISSKQCVPLPVAFMGHEAAEVIGNTEEHPGLLKAIKGS